MNNENTQYDQNKIRSISKDEQLFSFKFHIEKVIWKILTLLFWIMLSYSMVFYWALNGKILYIYSNGNRDRFFNGCCDIYVVDILFTRRIMIYRTKIVKTWFFGLRREVEFARAKYSAVRTPIFSTKRFYPNWTSDFFTPILGVYYDESLASNNDIRRVNQLLSNISGRKFDFFERKGIFSSSMVSLNEFLNDVKTNV